MKYLPYIYLHTAILLFGITGILGRLINDEGLSGVVLVWYRLMITLLSLFVFFPSIIGSMRRLPRKAFFQIAGIGCIVALHWITFYTSIEVSNSSIALSCLAATPFFTSLIEPLFFKRKVEHSEMLLGIIVILGFVFVFGFSAQFFWGIVIGISSALCASTFSVMNKAIVNQYDTYTIMGVEFLAGFVLLSMLLPINWHFFPAKVVYPTPLAWGYLLFLALVCTTIAYTFSMLALRHISAFTANLSINLEPVYGIIMAYYFFHEDKELSPQFYIGALLIVGSVFLHPFLKKII